MAFVVMVVFWELKGLVLEADAAEVVNVMLALADARVSEVKLATWPQEQTRKRKRGAV